MKKNFEKWSLPILKKYQKILLLEDHKLFLKYGKLRPDSILEHETNYPYKTSNILFDETALTFFKDGKLEELESAIIHELVHLITDPLHETAQQRYTNERELEELNERAVDHITNIIIKL
jgi:hypothetical protein